jgi:hypothetical protein
MKNILFLFFAFCSILPIYGQIKDTSYYSSKDAFIHSGTTLNYGTENNLQVGIVVSRGTATFRRSYVYFPLAGIPSNAVITSAVLKVYQVSGLTSTPSTEIKVERVTQSWTETGITSAIVPNTNTSDAVSSSTYSAGWRSFNVQSHVQEMVKGTYSNEGWTIRYFNETQSTANLYTFDSREAANDPVLEVSYYIPFSITAASITHCSTTSSTDGSITPTIINGSGSNTYKWYNSSGLISGQTSSSISGRAYGWYGLEVTGSQGDKYYYSFIIGVSCTEVTIEYDPGPNFIDDAYIKSLNSQDNPNYGNSVDFFTSKTQSGSIWTTNKSLIRFRLWVDPGLTINQAGLNLYGKSHSFTNSNASYLKKITDNWQEMEVKWTNAPATTATNQVSLAASTTSTQNYLNTNVSSFWNDWKSSNTTNYGMMLELQTTTNSVRSMSFHSSDASSSKPSMTFKFVHYQTLTGSVSAGSTNICSGTSTVMTVSSAQAGSTFQWQSSTNGSTYTNISGATNSTYNTLTSTTVDTWYRCIVSKGLCTSLTTNAVKVSVTPTPTVTVNQPDFCEGNFVTITATPSHSGGTYSWSTSQTSQSINVSPLITTGYTVTYTRNGCSSLPVTAIINVCQLHAKLERVLKGINYKTFAGRLVFYYHEEYSVGNASLNYRVYSLTNRITPVLSGTGLNQSLEYGDNRYLLDLSSISNGTYILEIENDKKEKFYLRFTK